MARTTKEGKRSKRRQLGGKCEATIGAAIMMRHVYGSTEKILRRNRKTWTRLANRRRRQLDKLACNEGAA